MNAPVIPRKHLTHGHLWIPALRGRVDPGSPFFCPDCHALGLRYVSFVRFKRPKCEPRPTSKPAPDGPQKPLAKALERRRAKVAKRLYAEFHAIRGVS